MTGEVGFHQAVDGAEDGRKGSGRPVDAVQVFEDKRRGHSSHRKVRSEGLSLMGEVGMGHLLMFDFRVTRFD